MTCPCLLRWVIKVRHPLWPWKRIATSKHHARLYIDKLQMKLLSWHLLTESRKTYYYQSCFPFLFANQRSGTVIAHICDVHFFKKRRCNFPHFVILKIALRSRLSREIQLTQRVPMTWTQVFSLFQYYWVLVEKNVALGWLGAPGRTFGLLKAYSKLCTIIQ